MAGMIAVRCGGRNVAGSHCVAPGYEKSKYRIKIRIKIRIMNWIKREIKIKSRNGSAQGALLILI